MIKNVILIATLLAATAVLSVQSNAGQDPGPETIALKNGKIPLQFSHRKHQNLQNSECFHCHLPEKWIIENWGKEAAHSMCISCHDLNEKGPIKCEECHK